ncbi:acetylornithine deacetylase/succinyl-diaminopimelate desuccinylase-like protein [Bradyrhizobium sp. USDA 4011]
MQHQRPDRIRKLLADLVAFDTISDRSNLPLIDYIERYLASLGVSGQRIVDDTGRKSSLWVTIGPEDKAGLVLSGHTGCRAGCGTGLEPQPVRARRA